MADNFDLSPEEMRSLGYKVIDHLVDHLSQLRNKPPVTKASRKTMDQLLLEEVPEAGQNPEQVLKHVTEKIFPFSNFINHPKYFAYVPSPGNYISTLADLLSTGYNTFSGGWSASSGPAETEIITINWLLKIFGLPVKRGGGIYTSGGSMANMTALATARHIKCGQDFSMARLYFSNQTHSSVIKGARVLGFKDEQIRIIPTGNDFRIRTDLLREKIDEDRENGLQPLAVVANAGSTNTGSVDDLQEVAKICEQYDLWMHVDAAYGGAAILSREGKEIMVGIERAHSITVDPHKWFFQPYEMGCILVRNFTWLAKTFRERPEYLREMSGTSREINFHELGLQLTRKFSALKLYMSIKVYGLSTFRNAVQHNISIIKQLETYLSQQPDWEIISAASLGVINFRYNSGNLKPKELTQLNHHISEIVTASGTAALLTTLLHQKTVLRICSTNPGTTFEDLKETVDYCEKVARVFLDSRR